MPKAQIKLQYVGPSRKAMGITAPGSNSTYRFTPGEAFSVPAEDGESILAAYPRLFEEVRSRVVPGPAREAAPAEDVAPVAGE